VGSWRGTFVDQSAEELPVRRAVSDAVVVIAGFGFAGLGNVVEPDRQADDSYGVRGLLAYAFVPHKGAEGRLVVKWARLCIEEREAPALHQGGVPGAQTQKVAVVDVTRFADSRPPLDNHNVKVPIALHERAPAYLAPSRVVRVQHGAGTVTESGRYVG